MPVPKVVVNCLFVTGVVVGGVTLGYVAFKWIDSLYSDTEQEMDDNQERNEEETQRNQETQRNKENQKEEEAQRKEEEIRQLNEARKQHDEAKNNTAEAQRLLIEAQKRYDEAHKKEKEFGSRLEKLHKRHVDPTHKISLLPTLKKDFLSPSTFPKNPKPTNVGGGGSWVEEVIRSRSGGRCELSHHESIIAASLTDPRTLDVSWCDVGGLDDVIAKLNKKVLLTVRKKHLIPAGCKLLKQRKGVLLYGPPGCGKTLIASALATEAGFPFLNVQASTLMDKWIGETEKLTKALFTLAVKMQPCVVFIDEIDSLLRFRSDSDSDTANKFKGLFLSNWDGVGTGNNQVVIMGATNRPTDLDSAFLSRMPVRFHIKPPSQTQREQILRVALKDFNVDPSVDLFEVSRQTEGLSGRDLKEVCCDAAVLCLDDSEESLRSIRQSDLLEAVAEMRETKAGILEDQCDEID